MALEALMFLHRKAKERKIDKESAQNKLFLYIFVAMFSAHESLDLIPCNANISLRNKIF